MNAFFYPSVNGDRVYDATAFEHWLKKFFTTGVFLNDLQVTANDDMTVNVGIGYSNVDGKVKIFEADTTLQIETAGATYPRIDSIVLERNDTERDVFLKVIKGGYSSEPIAHVPVRQDGVYQLVIAQIFVDAGAVKISQLDITDTRSDKELCGIVAGAVDQIDFSQIQAQFDAYMVNYAEYIADYAEQMQADFDAWFQNVRNQLDEDAAGHLQNQIDDINEQLENVGGSRVEVTVSDADGVYDVVGLTVNLEIDGQTYSKKVPSEKIVVFQVLETGTANISCVDETQGYTATASIDISCYSAYEATLSSGCFVDWLEAAGYTKEQYPTVEDVLADEKAVRKLMTVHASCDAFVDWYNADNSMLAQFTANRVAMKWIGLRDYTADKLMEIPSALEQLLASEHWEYILKDKIPVMTSNTAPEGTVSASSTFSGYYAYSAFDGKDNTGWMPLANAKNISLSYKFNNPIAIKKFSVIMQKFNSVTDVTLELRASNDGVYWVTLDTFTSGSTERVIDNDTPYLHYGIYSPEALAVEGVGYWEIRTLQFYGRSLNESVPVMTSNTAPLGKCTASGVYDALYDAYKAFDGDDGTNSNGWAPDASGKFGSTYVQYEFEKPIKVSLVSGFIKESSSSPNLKSVYKLAASKDGETFTPIVDSMELNKNKTYHNADSNEAFKYYRIFIISNNFDAVDKGHGCKFQLYGVSYSEEEFGSDGIEMLYDYGVEVANVENFAQQYSEVKKYDDYVTAITKSSSYFQGGLSCVKEFANDKKRMVSEYDGKMIEKTIVYLGVDGVGNSIMNAETNKNTSSDTITKGKVVYDTSQLSGTKTIKATTYNSTTFNVELAKLRKWYLLK